jgi:hypothetical protein
VCRTDARCARVDEIACVRPPTCRAGGNRRPKVRRELIRIRAGGSLRRLECALDPSSGFDHLTLATGAIIKAAELWAIIRHSGIPTASPDALNADAILAAQAALAGQPGDTLTIATTNLAHLSRIPGIDAQIWDRVR